MTTSSRVPLIKRLAKENKIEEMDCEIFNFRRATNTNERQEESFKDKKFLKYFEYIKI